MDTGIDKNELIPLVRANKVMELLPIFLNRKPEDFEVSPSEYIHEMTLTMEERHKKLVQMSSMNHQSFQQCTLGILVTPNILVFQSFVERERHTLQIQVRNCRKVLLPLKMICPKSSFFTADFVNSSVTKLAPGLTVEYTVTFNPTELKDYSHYLNFKSDTELFRVPIIAIGPRPLLDIPDEITIQPSPVKIATSKIVIVRNIGTIPAGFKFTSKGCFRFEPAKGTVGVKELLHLSVIFEPSVTGHYSETLYLLLETGEKLAIKVHGTAENINVRLDKNKIVHDDTYIGLKRSKVFHIQNNSHSLIKFSWKRNKTLEEDLDIIEVMKDKYKELKDLEVAKDMKQNYHKLCSKKTHELAWERILNDELRLLQAEEFRFQHPSFKIEPENGEIFPKTHVEMMAVFEPTECGPVSAEAYLEISGRDERLTLQMRGNGLGPVIELSIEILDIDFIFLCSVHTYEVVAMNKGNIPGTITFKQEPLVFGGKVDVMPNSRYLKPSEHAALIIAFTSNRHGDFTEKLNFLIVESGETISLALKGKIVSPTLHFDKTQIDFGTIPVGFPVSKEVTLSNLSMVPVTFSLRMLSEGSQPSMSYEKFSKLTIKPPLPKSPKEFNIIPMEGVVEPYSNRTVTLTLTANIARKWTTHLMVDMWDSETESVSCPVRFNSQIASIAVQPSNISIPFCFVNFPYTRIVTLENVSKISGFFYIIPQDPEKLHTLTYSSSISQGVLEPRGTVKVSLTIQTNTLGRQTVPLHILILGNEIPHEMCQICCVGQGPVVTIKPTNLVWGEVPLLEESVSYMTINNESPIPATFYVTMAKADSPWSVNPSHGVLPPEDKLTLKISLLLRDRGKYQDILRIQILNGKTLNCSTSAIGVGNSLLIQPNINDKYDLGTLFSHKKYSFEILMKNEGTKPISVVWCPIDDYRAFVAKKFSNPPDLIFKMEPTRVDLPGRSSRPVNLEIQTSQTGSFSQNFYCHLYANIEMPTKELYMVSEVVAEFVEPLVEFDKTELDFYYNISAIGIQKKLTDVVTVINNSVLPLSFTAAVNQPFYLRRISGVITQKDEIHLSGKESKKITVGFVAEEDPGRYCQIYKDKLSISFKEHSKKTSLFLIGEVNYPNVIILPRSINFGCIPVAASAYKEFIIVNVSPVSVHFNITWDEKNSSLEYLETAGGDAKEFSDYGYSERSLKIDIKQHDNHENEDMKEVAPEDSVAISDSKTFVETNRVSDGAEAVEEPELVPPVKPILKIPEISVTDDDIKQVVFPLVRRYHVDDEELNNANKTVRSLTDNDRSTPAFIKCFDITPFYGKLDRYETQVISVSFQPNASMKAKVQALVDIESGPREKLHIEAKAADLDFVLNKTHIKFGRQLFCETASEYLKIKNTSWLEFDFETDTIEPIGNDANGDFPIEAGLLVITPRTGHVPPMSEKTLRIRYNPGLPGKFEEKFQLRIGYLDPITILVSGLAVFPQVYFSLPRSEISELPADIIYAAIASITPDWLTKVNSTRPRNRSNTIKWLDRETELRKHDDKQNVDNEESDKWTVISDSECLPSSIDIELAVERIMAFKLLSQVNQQSDPIVFARSIPHFSVPAYEIDFGVVTSGRSVEETFSVRNYGPLPLTLYYAGEKDAKKRVMQIKMKARTEIQVGDSTQITIKFEPKRSRFMGQYEQVENVFYFEVNQGARIPVKASAVVTYPFVVPSTKSLNFNEVKCGNCKVMCMKLRNFGWVPASWSTMFRLTSREIAVMHRAGVLDGRLMFHLTTNKGVLFPNESCLLKISFKPDFGGKFSATLVIKVEEGFDEHRITLSGEAVEARLKISETALTFEPTLPYPRRLYKCFTIHNPSPFPVEFYFPDFDEQILEEDKVLRAITIYYQTNELLLPARNPGDKLPTELTDFYRLLLDIVNMKCFEKKRDRRLHSTQSPSAVSVALDDIVSLDHHDKKRFKYKKGSSFSARPRSSIISQNQPSVSNLNPDMISVFKDKTQGEIEEILHDQIKADPTLGTRFDPLKGLFDSMQLPRKSDTLESVQGLVVVLIAAPQKNLLEFEKLCSKAINRPVTNIDRIILEEVALCRCDPAITLRDIIEQTFSERFESKTLSPSAENVADSSPLAEFREQTFEELLEDLESKIQQILSLKDGITKPKSGTANEDKVLSLGSAKKDKSSTSNTKPVFQGNSFIEGYEQLLLEIIKFRLHVEAVNGVLLENNESKWIPNNLSALKLIVQAAGNISDLLVICLTNSYQKYKEFRVQKDSEEEQCVLQRRENALRILEEEPEDKFNALKLGPDEEKELRQSFINSRREEHKKYVKAVEERARLRDLPKLNKHLQKKALLTPTNSQSTKGQQVTPHKEKDKAVDGSTKGNVKSKERDKRPRSGLSTRVKSAKKEENEEEKQFIIFEEQLLEMINFLENWDRCLGNSVGKQQETQLGNKSRKSSTRRVPSTVVQETTEKSSSDVGVPLWLVEEGNLKSTITELVSMYLGRILLNRRISHDSGNWALAIPSSTTYSVVTPPPHRHPTNLLNTFTLTTIDKSVSLVLTDDEFAKTNSHDKVEQAESVLSVKPKKRSSDVGKGRAESRTLTAGKNALTKKSLPSTVLDDQPLKSRCILEEGESTFWCVQFSPTKVGKYEQLFPVNLVLGPSQNNYVIKCTGICDIPRLDMSPENIFSRIAAEKPADLIYSPTFFYSNQCFDFGSVIPNQSKDEGHNHEVHAIFSLTNISTIPVELTVMFADDAVRESPIGSQNFDLEPSSAYLKPNQTFLLNVYANPSKYGSIKEELLLFVKDNPKVEMIKIKCYGIRVSVNLEPKFIDFDRILLYRKAKRRITFTNNNLIPLFLALSGCDNLPPQFSFSATESWVQPLDSFIIEIEYEAREVQVISEEVIHVLVYDRIETKDPVQTLTFRVSAEAYDASVDIYFASKEENHVDFEEMRIQKECKKPVTLKNTGKYDLGFKIEIDHDLLRQNGNVEFFVSPEEGKLPVGKMFTLYVHFQAKTEVNWKRLPLFRITLTEPYNKNELVASIPIEVSAKSFFSRYVIEPLSEVNIGPVQVGSQKTVALSIENKGHFSFTYSIEPLTEAVPVLDIESNKKSSKKTSEASSKEKSKKVTGAFKVGCFEITPSFGTVAVRETSVVNMTFSPTEMKQYEETLILKVSETPPHLKQGNELKLLAEGCIPQVNFGDFPTIFREHQIKKNEKDPPHTEDIGYRTLFITDENQFWFKNVCLGKTVEARLHFLNTGQIDCHIKSSVSKRDSIRRSRNLSESENDTFWVKPADIIIPPYETGTFTVCFRPETLQIYKCQVVLSLLMPERYTAVNATYNFNATVCTPEIEIIEPLSRSADGQGLVSFPPTTPGRTSTSVISFKNVGKIESKVVLQIYHSEQNVFSAVPKANTESMAKAWEPGKPIYHTVLVTVEPGRTAEFTVYFNPLEIGKYTCEIKLFIVDNGFENICYKLYGQAYLEEVVLEKIQTEAPFSNEMPQNPSSYIRTVPGHYFLNLGHCFINKKKMFLARLSNKTDRDYFRFEWEEIPASITVQPSHGHLYPSTYKEVFFEFLPQDSTEMEEFPLTCSLKKIQFAELPPGPSWDSRLTYYQTVPANETDISQSKSTTRTSSRQEAFQMNEVLIYGQEPDFEVIPDSGSGITIFISAVADYARLHCETKTINFADTYMFQSRIFSFALENVGKVSFDYTFELKSVTYGPLKIDEASQVDPRLRPVSAQRDTADPISAQRKTAKKKTDANKPKPLGNEVFMNLFSTQTEDPCFAEDTTETRIELYNPIHLAKERGTIMPKEKVYPEVVFSPLDANLYKGILKINVENIHPDYVPPEIEVNARSVMPFCHFDIPESDYIHTGRRDHSRPGPIGTGPGLQLDPQIKTIEIRIIGVRVTEPIHFHAINPTDKDYSFSWSNVTHNEPGVVQSLHCTYLDGVIQAGRQKLMEFVFVSQYPGTFEYFWKFCIPEHHIEMTFLFAIFVQEPIIHFLSSNLIMKPTCIGATVTDVITLINQEDVASDFFFLPDSLYSDGRYNSLKVQPLSGKINPKSEINFRISFTGKRARKALFHLKCKVKKLQNPLTVIVETMTHSVEPLVTFENLEGAKLVAYPSTDNAIDFGKELQTDKPEQVKFFLRSTSKLSFYYEWVYDKKELLKWNCLLNFSQMEGHVTSHARSECTLTITFTKKSKLVNFPIKLKITSGPTYNFLLSASATTPTYEFSFLSYDFGYCYVQNTDFSFYETVLTFKNKDKVDLPLDSTTDNLQNFTFNLSENVVGPGKELLIPVSFYPRETVKYEEQIRFIIGGLCEKVVTLSGQGTEFKVTLKNVSDANIQMGATHVGNKRSREFEVVNKGLANATILIGFPDQLPVNLLCLARPKENPVDLVSDHRLSNILSLSPSKPVILRPKESQTLRVEYTPRERISSFTETVYMQFQDRVDPLCVITGSSVGPEFSLDKKYLAFGAVVANYSTSLKFKIINSGDIGARFKWETHCLGNEFSMLPESGYLSPGSDIVIEVTFHPKAVGNFISKMAECRIAMSDTETYPPLNLKLTGKCVDLPRASKVVTFVCNVREVDVKAIAITNMTGKDWRLMPVFSGEYFTGSDFIYVPSMSTTEYEITYRPLTMTQATNGHKETLFYCLPDGTGQLYELLGTSLPPPACEVIQREVPCKTKYTELIRVSNWLRCHQRFRVTRAGVKNEGSDDLVFTCSGSDTFELPPSAEKEYKVTFFAYKVGKLQITVTFTNSETKEYIWFDLRFNVVMCGPLQVITLKSSVRQSATYGIKLENPLGQPVQFKMECSNPEVLLPPATVLPPKSTATLDIAFRPLHTCEKTEQLKITCPELGAFPMKLQLVASEAAPQECIHFEAPLGSVDVQTVSVPNYHYSQATLICRTTSGEFKVDERVTVASQDSASVNITYEPSSLEQSFANLYIESEQAGNFVYPLAGKSLKPLAQGPYLLQLGQGFNISFKNVLREAKTFQVYVDNPAFSVKSDQEEIQPGREVKINVSLNKLNAGTEKLKDTVLDVRYPVMGQLVVECFDPHIKWQYYLKGVFEKTSQSKP